MVPQSSLFRSTAWSCSKARVAAQTKRNVSQVEEEGGTGQGGAGHISAKYGGRAGDHPPEGLEQ